jgi:hypothetical protein
MAKKRDDYEPPAPEPVEPTPTASELTVSPADEISILKERIAELEAPVKVEYPKWVTKDGARYLVQSEAEHKAVCGSLKE